MVGVGRKVDVKVIVSVVLKWYSLLVILFQPKVFGARRCDEVMVVVVVILWWMSRWCFKTPVVMMVIGIVVEVEGGES